MKQGYLFYLPWLTHFFFHGHSDITWCGGMTEARRIVALAAAYDIPIIPHGSSIYSYHLQICFPNCPMAEFLVMSPKADSIGKKIKGLVILTYCAFLLT